MAANLQPLIQKYHIFYEVLPYNIVIEEGHGSPTMTRRTIQAGFDVDVHGLSDKTELELPPANEYGFAYAELKKIANSVSHHASECSIEAIPFPSTVFSEADEQFPSGAIIRIRISHSRGINQPAGLPEQRALEEVEKQLHSLGIARR